MSILALRALPWKLIGAGAIALAFLFLYASLKDARSDRDRYKAQAQSLRDLRETDRRNFEAAAKEAARLNREQVARIKADQDRVTQETSREYQADLARLRRDFALRLSGAAKANPGSPGQGRTGTVPGAASGTDGEARLCYAPEDVLRAAENELRHEALIEWIEAQRKVER